MAKDQPKNQSTPETEGGVTDPKEIYGITDRDLLFDCPHCGKNFVIDQQAAGSAFSCPECERDIEIPPLETLMSAASQATPEVQEDMDDAINGTDGRVLELQHELNQAHEEIALLKTEIEELRFRRRFLEKEKSKHAKLVEDINSQVRILRASLDQISETLNDSGKIGRDTQQID